MAENQVPETEIAQELTRIENAKGTLVNKAQEMQLVFTDDDGGWKTPTQTDPIEFVAEAFNDIKTINPEKDFEVVGHTVTYPKGYIPNPSVYGLPQATIDPPLITISNDGLVTARTPAKTGYVEMSEDAVTEEVIANEHLIAENIRSRASIFGVEGTFTKDASIPMEQKQGVSGVYESDHLAQGCTVYADGKKVEGTLLSMGAETIVEIDPLTETVHVAIENPVRVNYLSVRLKGDLLNRLKAI